MAWEWVAPTATAGVGVAGMWFTYRTGRTAREAQTESERRALVGTRHRDLTALRQDVYARFVGAVRELMSDAAAQGAVNEITTPGAARDALTVVQFPELVRRFGAAEALHEQVKLLADDAVASAAHEVMTRLLATLTPRSRRSEENQRKVEELPGHISRLVTAMSAEIRS